MQEKSFNQLMFWGLAGIVVFAVLAFGAVQLWAVTIIQALVLVLLFGWFWRMNNRPGRHVQAGGLGWPVWLFVGLGFVSWWFGIYRYAGMLSMFRLLSYVGVYYLAVNHLRWGLQLKFSVVLVLLGAGLSLLGIGQYFFGLDQWWWNSPRLLSATYVNHSHFAGMLEMAMPLAVGLLAGLNRQDAGSRFKLTVFRVLLASGTGLMLAAFILTQSRGGWIVFCLSLMVLFAVLGARRTVSRQGMAVFLLGMVLCIVFLGLGSDRVAYRLHSIELGEGSTLFRGRIEVWRQCIEMIKDRPLAGWGIGTFYWAFPAYRPPGLWPRHHFAHNDYLQTAVEVGLVGIPLVIWGIGLVLRQAFSLKPDEDRLQRSMRLACGVGLLALMLHGLVDFNFHIPANALIFACLTAMVMRRQAPKDRPGRA